LREDWLCGLGNKKACRDGLEVVDDGSLQRHEIKAKMEIKLIAQGPIFLFSEGLGFNALWCLLSNYEKLGGRF